MTDMTDETINRPRADARTCNRGNGFSRHIRHASWNSGMTATDR
jgi:hypothetical protein